MSWLSLGGIEFATPAALLLLLLLPAWLYWRRRKKPAAMVFSRAPVLARGPRTGQFVARTIITLRVLVLTLGIIALARPRTGARSENVVSEGINIVIVIDLSSSMLAEDFQPLNRMEVAKQRTRDFIQGRTADRIGLVAFAGEALTQVPLTVDYPVLQAAVRNLQAGMLEDGTAIGTAIATAANRLRDAPGQSRVMVLMTDGENNR
jgi:Ca-activated chloride channel homolog